MRVKSMQQYIFRPQEDNFIKVFKPHYLQYSRIHKIIKNVFKSMQQ